MVVIGGGSDRRWYRRWLWRVGDSDRQATQLRMELMLSETIFILDCLLVPPILLAFRVSFYFSSPRCSRIRNKKRGHIVENFTSINRRIIATLGIGLEDLVSVIFGLISDQMSDFTPWIFSHDMAEQALGQRRESGGQYVRLLLRTRGLNAERVWHTCLLETERG